MKVATLMKEITVQGKKFLFEVDKGAGENFMSYEVWKKKGKPESSLSHL